MKAKGIIEHRGKINRNGNSTVRHYIVVASNPSGPGLKEYRGRRLLKIFSGLSMGPFVDFDASPDVIKWLSTEECLTHPQEEIRIAAMMFLVEKKEITDYTEFPTPGTEEAFLKMMDTP